MTLADVTPGDRVRTLLTQAQYEEFDEYLFGGDRVMEGTVVEADAGALLLEVPLVTVAEGIRVDSYSQRLRIPAQGLADVEVRSLSRGRPTLSPAFSVLRWERSPGTSSGVRAGVKPARRYLPKRTSRWSSGFRSSDYDRKRFTPARPRGVHARRTRFAPCGPALLACLLAVAAGCITDDEIGTPLSVELIGPETGLVGDQLSVLYNVSGRSLSGIIFTWATARWTPLARWAPRPRPDPCSTSTRCRAVHGHGSGGRRRRGGGERHGFHQCSGSLIASAARASGQSGAPPLALQKIDSSMFITSRIVPHECTADGRTGSAPVPGRLQTGLARSSSMTNRLFDALRSRVGGVGAVGVVILALALAVPGAAQAQDGAVTGTVTDGTSGRPVGSVQVYLDGTGLERSPVTTAASSSSTCRRASTRSAPSASGSRRPRRRSPSTWVRPHSTTSPSQPRRWVSTRSW